MSYRDLVSVIIPVYNREVLLQEALESVLSQTYPRLEIIIADDGSTDSTLDSLAKYREKADIKILSLPHSGYAGLVRNRAAFSAKGRWLAFLDSDDLWEKDKLKKQIDYLNKYNEYKFIHTLEKWVRNDKKVSQAHRKHKKEGDLFEVSLGKCEIGPSTVVMEKELFMQYGGFREDLEICEDYEFWLRVTSENIVAYLDEPLVIKRGGLDDQLSAKYGFIEIFKIDALKGLVDNFLIKGERLNPARKELARKCRIYSRGCRKRGRIEEADEFEFLYRHYSVDDVQIEG